MTQPAIEVTASRVSQTVDENLTSVSVITRQDIEGSGANDLLDLLRLQAGVDMTRTGGLGSTEAMFLRGTNSNHVLVLIDGIRVASANTGAYTFEQLPLDVIERIEIARGSRASYWGSDAIGGVIQIFTRRLEGARMSARFGRYEDANGSVGYGNWSEKGGYSVQVGAHHVEGFSAQNSAGFSYDPDDDAYQNHHLVARGEWRSGHQKMSTNILRSEGNVDFDQGNTVTLNQAWGISWNGEMGSSWHHQLSAGEARERLSTPAFFSIFSSKRENLSWQNNFSFSQNSHFVTGIDYSHEHGENRDTALNISQYATSRQNVAVFGGWHTQVTVLDSEISVRYDRNSEFGGELSGSGALAWQFNPNGRLRFSYGTGFRSPNLNEQFSPGYGGLFAGNPTLEPEQSHSVEIGVNYKLDRTSEIDIRAFSTRIDNLISFTGGNTFQAVNIDHAAIDGMEVEHRWQDSYWIIQNNLTWQDPRNLDTDMQLLRRPKLKTTHVVERSWGKTTAGLEFLWVGKRDDVTAILPSYSLTNLRFQQEISEDWDLDFRLENVFNHDYELVHGFNTPGRSFSVQVSWHPTP